MHISSYKRNKTSVDIDLLLYQINAGERAIATSCQTSLLRTISKSDDGINIMSPMVNIIAGPVGNSDSFNDFSGLDQKNPIIKINKNVYLYSIARFISQVKQKNACINMNTVMCIMFHTFHSAESRPFRKKQRKKKRYRNRQNINFTLKTFVGSPRHKIIKYGTTLRKLEHIIKEAYGTKNGVKLFVGSVQINKQENQEKTIGDLIEANTQQQYTILVVFQPTSPK